MPKGINPKQPGFSRPIERTNAQSSGAIQKKSKPANKFQIHHTLIEQSHQPVQNSQKQFVQATRNSHTNMDDQHHSKEKEEVGSSDKFKIVNYEYNSSNNLHFKT